MEGVGREGREIAGYGGKKAISDKDEEEEE